jgi:hypothetical protein
VSKEYQRYPCYPFGVKAWMVCMWNFLVCNFTYIHRYIPLTLYPQRGSRGLSDICVETPTFCQSYLAVRNTADVTNGKPIAVWSIEIWHCCSSSGDFWGWWWDQREDELDAYVRVLLKKQTALSTFVKYSICWAISTFINQIIKIVVYWMCWA